MGGEGKEGEAKEGEGALDLSASSFWQPWLRACYSVGKQKQRGLRGYYVAGPPLLNERCTSLLAHHCSGPPSPK